MRPVVYLSVFFPPKKINFIFGGMRSAANISASAFSYSLLSGLTEVVNEGLYVINSPLTGPYPINYKRPYTRKLYTIEYGKEVESIGICNIYGLQVVSIYNHAYNAMSALGIGEADILVYSIQLPLLQAAIKYKKKNRGSRIILVVPDLYEDINNSSIFISTIKKSLFGNFETLCEEVDGYVLLTDLMRERMPTQKPYCVVEGIYNPTEKRIPLHTSKDVFRILYTGMLYEKFGVKNLVDAVCSINIPNIKLILCGSGDVEAYIKNKSTYDSRIVYQGIIPREQVLELQCTADLLVNPRQPNGEFTRYSFPSKNIEYLSSGTPTLIYELEGIPKEYFNYCYHLSMNQRSTEELASMIVSIYNTPQMDREELALKAQRYIMTEKNATAQGKRIMDFISHL